MRIRTIVRPFMRDGVRIKSHKRDILDMGRRGLTPKSRRVLPPLNHPGSLGEGFYSKPTAERHKILGRLTASKGERRTGGMMQWAATMNKRTNPNVAKKAIADRTWVHKTFDGKRRA